MPLARPPRGGLSIQLPNIGSGWEIFIGIENISIAMLGDGGVFIRKFGDADSDATQVHQFGQYSNPEQSLRALLDTHGKKGFVLFEINDIQEGVSKALAEIRRIEGMLPEDPIGDVDVIIPGDSTTAVDEANLAIAAFLEALIQRDTEDGPAKNIEMKVKGT